MDSFARKFGQTKVDQRASQSTFNAFHQDKVKEVLPKIQAEKMV